MTNCTKRPPIDQFHKEIYCLQLGDMIIALSKMQNSFTNSRKDVKFDTDLVDSMVNISNSLPKISFLQLSTVFYIPKEQV